MAATTKQPTGLAITRNGMKFTLSWKIADEDYKAGQQFQWRTNVMAKNIWNSVTIGVGSTQKTVALSAADYYPTTDDRLSSITFRVRGKRKAYTVTKKVDKKDVTTTITPGWSDWTSKSFSILAPSRPSLTAALDDSADNLTTFTWELEDDTTSHKPFYDVQYQTLRLMESTITDGSAIKWNSSQPQYAAGTGSASGSEPYQEDSTTLATGSFTRWFRVRARGAAGPSDWRYGKHVYALPYKPKIESVGYATSGGYPMIGATWTAGANAAHPIDLITLQYAIETPGAGQAAPSGFTDAASFKDTKGKDGARFTIDQNLLEDQCLWIRLMAQHDRNSKRPSSPVLVYSGSLKAPSGLSVAYDTTTGKATVTATNESSVPDSKLAIIFRKRKDKDKIIGIIVHGESSAEVKCPAFTDSNEVAIGVYAYQGTESYYVHPESGVSHYSISANMESASVFTGIEVPDPPSVPRRPNYVTGKLTNSRADEVELTWDVPWKDADSAEISWSKRAYAWESTEQPQTYVIDDITKTKWRISGLEPGSTYYFRIRLIMNAEDGPVYSAYTKRGRMELTLPPEQPVLTLSASKITADGNLTASWTCKTRDGSAQSTAVISAYSSDNATIRTVVKTSTEQSILISAADMSGNPDTTCYLRVRIVTSSGQLSEFSDWVPVKIAALPTVAIESTSSIRRQNRVLDYNPVVTFRKTAGSISELQVNAEDFDINYHINHVDGTYTFTYANDVWRLDGMKIDPEDYGISYYEVSNGTTIEITLATDPETDRPWVLKSLPLTIETSGSGAGFGGTTSVTIVRLGDYFMERPDESRADGYDGEIIVSKTRRQSSTLVINKRNLIGSLDDGAFYRLIVTATDKMGQKATVTRDFMVGWENQAGYPTNCTARISGLVAVLRAEKPENWAEGGKLDIYRLSADKPELIIENGSYETRYVDPYPAIGETGGYRFVCRTADGDYITPRNHPAWVDVEIEMDEYSLIIDFNGDRVILPYNITLSSKWAKDFKKTDYLGGSQVGDWNPAVTRTSTYSTVLLTDENNDIIEAMRRLADYSGICHIRTPEGSSYPADVQVSDNTAFNTGYSVSYTLTVTRVDPEEPEGMKYSDWSNE